MRALDDEAIVRLRALVEAAEICQREAQRLYTMQRAATDPVIVDMLERRGNTADACGAQILALANRMVTPIAPDVADPQVAPEFAKDAAR